MSTQTRLTLSSVLVMTAIVVIISILDLGYQMDAQFEATLEHAELLKRIASNAVVDTLNSDRQHPWRETLPDSNLDRNLIDIMSASHALLEIAVCDKDNKIILDSDPNSRGKNLPVRSGFRARGRRHQLAGKGPNPQPAGFIPALAGAGDTREPANFMCAWSSIHR